MPCRRASWRVARSQRSSDVGCSSCACETREHRCRSVHRQELDVECREVCTMDRLGRNLDSVGTRHGECRARVTDDEAAVAEVRRHRRTRRHALVRNEAGCSGDAGFKESCRTCKIGRPARRHASISLKPFASIDGLLRAPQYGASNPLWMSIGNRTVSSRSSIAAHSVSSGAHFHARLRRGHSRRAGLARAAVRSRPHVLRHDALARRAAGGPARARHGRAESAGQSALRARRRTASPHRIGAPTTTRAVIPPCPRTAL